MDHLRQAMLETLDAILTRTAETVGDITAPVMREFYRRQPDAAAAFDYHGANMRERLEAEMVEKALYNVMTWLENPEEVTNLIYGSVPHHRFMLAVRPEWYAGLLDTVLDTIERTIPGSARNEVELIGEVRAGLAQAVSAAVDLDEVSQPEP